MEILEMRELLNQGKTIYDLPLRVTFYSRVSTDLKEQETSLENQIYYYKELIQTIARPPLIHYMLNLLL